jgi:hypothetical protein
VEQIALFDYAALDAETRIVVQQRTSEIKTLMRRSAQDIIDIGQKLIEVKARLGHGHFGGWLESEFGWSQDTAGRFINVAQRFDIPQIADFNIAPSALYALSAPSTPEPARAEAIERAQAGEPITHSAAKAIIEEYKASKVTPPVANGNGYRAPINERPPVIDDEEEAEEFAETVDGYTWTEPTEDEPVDLPRPAPPVVSRSVSPTVPLSVPLTAPAPKMAVHFSSETPEHYTPRMVIDAVIECMGGIDLDPCSNSHESPNVPAGEHFTADDDGLRQVWRGRVYMNPPYGREIVDWVDKLVKAHESGSVTEAIALVPARTDTKWWAMLRDYPVCLVSGRLKFGEAENGAPFPSAIFYLPNGTAIDRFYDAFSSLGDIWQRTTKEMVAS